MEKFLFQIGSIRSWACNTSLEDDEKRSFYSKLVRLEELWVDGLSVVGKCFYSKLVRLEVKGIEKEIAKATFLFQIGSIRRRR